MTFTDHCLQGHKNDNELSITSNVKKCGDSQPQMISSIFYKCFEL